jgi:hypothetical protein
MEGAILLEPECAARHHLFVLTSLLQRFLLLISNSNESRSLHPDDCGKLSACLSAHRTKSYLLFHLITYRVTLHHTFLPACA